MNFVVIGEPCIDVIHKTDEKKFHSFGGILYSVISLSVLAKSTDKIIPVFYSGEDEHENILKLLGEYGNIITDGIKKIDQPARRVNLFYDSIHERIETSTMPVKAIEFEWIEKFLDHADSVLVNMISGVDIDLDTFKLIRKNFDGFIHIDIHNLVMKTGEDGSRTQGHLENWREWCSIPDTVQMNEAEVKILSSERKNEYQVSEEILINNPDSKVNGVIITKGIEGVTGYLKMEKKFGNNSFIDLDRQNVRAIENPKFIDSTGCGDVFASAFTYDFTNNRDFVKSLHYANRIASYKTSLVGVKDLIKLK
jgi:fructose-1-phosphate kinase PfkB-like protein